MFQGDAVAGLYQGCLEERRRSVYVIVPEDFSVEGLPDPECTHPARVVRDMRKDEKRS